MKREPPFILRALVKIDEG